MPPLSNTEVFYLPPNTTSKLQPCDAGINRSFKAYYRRNFHQRLLQNIENGIVDPMKVDMLEAIKMCIEAWGNVKASTIRNCFQHCNIRTRSISTPIITADMIDEPVLIQELNNQLAQFPFSNLMDINFPLNHPSERETYTLPTDDEIIQQVNGQEQENLSSEEMDDSNEPQKVSPSEALKLLDLIELSLLQQNSNQMENLTKVQSLKEAFTSAHRSSLAQTSLDRYFL